MLSSNCAAYRFTAGVLVCLTQGRRRLTSLLRIVLLGGFRLLHGATPVAGIDNARLQSLLAYLILHRDAPQSRAQLSYLFWRDSTEAQAHANLRKQVYHLRRALPDADRFLYVSQKVLQWRPDAPFTLDVHDFEAALARAEEAESAGHRSSLREALEQAAASYHGDLLPSCYDDWVLTERERLQHEFARTLERMIGLLEGERAYPAAIEYAQRLLHHDPLHEEAYCRLITLYALNGDRARAMRTYHTCATILRRELQVEPSPTTQEAYERLLARDAEAALPAKHIAPKKAGRSRKGMGPASAGLEERLRRATTRSRVVRRSGPWQDAPGRGDARVGPTTGYRHGQRPVLRQCRRAGLWPGGELAAQSSPTGNSAVTEPGLAERDCQALA